MTQNFDCSMCYFTSRNYAIFCQHSVRMHKNDPNFIVHCSVGGCAYSSKSWNAFKIHCSRKHLNACTVISNIQTEVNDSGSEDDSFVDSVLHNDEDAYMSQRDQKAYFNAAFLLNLESQHNLSKAAVDAVVASTSLLIDTHQSLYKAQIQEALVQNGIQQPFDVFPENVFDTLKTDFLRQKFFTTHCNLIQPVGIVLGKSPIIKNGRKIDIRKKVGYYVPLFDSIQALLRLPDVASFMHRHHLSTNGYMYDICDGEYFRENKLFQEDINSIQIILNTDEIEVVNPLGSHVKKHKLSMFYYTIANIPPQFRSQLSSIQLLAVALTKDLKQFGIKKLLKDFVCSMKQLATHGKVFTIETNAIKMKGTLTIAPCDTPAAGWLGGLKEGVSFAYKCCRVCDAPPGIVKTLLHEDASLLRTTHAHKIRCQTLSNLSVEARAYWGKLWGINNTSVLCDIPDLDIPGCLVQDPMHVLLEGIVRTEIRLLLAYCVNKKFFSLKWFYSQLLSFGYSKRDSKNMPQLIDAKALKPGGKLKQTAIETFTLFCLLPFLIGDKVPKENDNWVNALHLIQIMLLSTSPYVNALTASCLEHLIFIYLSNFTKCYPTASFVPKMHYLTHFPRQMLLFGPLRLHWCMRFEGKHGFFKKIKWTNFKNLPLSIANKHQLWMCYKQLGHNGRVAQNFLYDGDHVAEGEEVSFSVLFPSLVSPFKQDTVYCTPRLHIHGLQYEQETVLLLDILHLPTTPVLVVIKNILVVQSVKFFIVAKLLIEEFCKHLNSYIVTETAERVVVKFSDLKFHWPETFYSMKGRKYVMLRCSPFVEPLC